MKIRIPTPAALIGALFLVGSTTSARSEPVDGQMDTFDGGALQGWMNGAEFRVVGFTDGGPAGAGDGYLEISSDGGGAGGRLTVINADDRWTGDWLSAGVTDIDVDLVNDGNEPLEIRLKLQRNTTNNYTEAVTVPADGQWATYSFGVLPAELTGASPETTLGRVDMLRIEHNPLGSHPPPFLTAVLGIDNLTAYAVPSFCGDDVCDADEDELSCPADCPAVDVCGDGLCGASEDDQSCPDDCAPADVCGDGLITGDEVCDGADLAGQTCASQGFDTGTLQCSSHCRSFDVNQCETIVDNADGGGCSTADSSPGVLLLLLALTGFALRRRRLR